jgi:hypothetical protein
MSSETAGALAQVSRLKVMMCSDGPDLRDSLSQFQSILEFVGTPESVERTLGHLKQLKMHVFLQCVRQQRGEGATTLALLEALRETEDRILIKQALQDPTIINQFLWSNDQSLSCRLLRFSTDLLAAEGDSAQEDAVIEALLVEENYSAFIQSFCAFLDRIMHSLLWSCRPKSSSVPRSVSLDQHRSVSLPRNGKNSQQSLISCNDLLHIVSRERLLGIHRGEDPDLVQFLTKNELLGEMFPSLSGLFSTPGTNVMLPICIPPSETIEAQQFEQPRPTRKRPHEEAINVVGKRRAVATLDEDEVDLAYISQGPLLPIREMQIPSMALPLELPELEPLEEREEVTRTGGTHRGQRKRRKWSDVEVDQLLEGVRLFGVGFWKDILVHFDFGDRTHVDLKDKFRNLRKYYSLEELLGRLPTTECT